MPSSGRQEWQGGHAMGRHAGHVSKAGEPKCWCRRRCRRLAGQCGVPASPGALRREWDGGSSETGTGNDIGTAQSAGPGPWGPVGLLRQPLPRGRRGGRAACRSRREQQLQLG